MATLIDEKGLQHYADKMVKAENRKVGTKSLPTALTEIDAMIDSMKGKFDQVYGDPLEASFNNIENVFKIGSGIEEDRSDTAEEGFISVDKLKGQTLVNRLKGANKTVKLPCRIELEDMMIKPDTDYTFQSSSNEAIASFKQPKYKEVICQNEIKLENNLNVNNKIELRSIEGQTAKNELNIKFEGSLAEQFYEHTSSHEKFEGGYLVIKGENSNAFVNMFTEKNSINIDKSNKYTFVLEVINNTLNSDASFYISEGSRAESKKESFEEAFISAANMKTGFNKVLLSPIQDSDYNPLNWLRMYLYNYKTGELKFRFYLLKGNWIDKPTPGFFEEVQGVGKATKNLWNGFNSSVFLKSGTYTISSDDTVGARRLHIGTHANQIQQDDVTAKGFLFNGGKYILLSDTTKLNHRFSVNKDMILHFGFEGNEYSNVQLEEGTVATPYEPYYEGYKIAVETCGKNLIKELEIGSVNNSGDYIQSNNTLRPKEFIKVKPSTQYILDSPQNGYKVLIEYDANKKFIMYHALGGSHNNPKTVSDNCHYISFRYEWTVGGVDRNDKVSFEEGRSVSSYEPYKSSAYEFILSQQLHAINNVKDRLYWDKSKGKYCIEKNIACLNLSPDESQMWFKPEFELPDSYAFYIERRGAEQPKYDQLPLSNQLASPWRGESFQGTDKEMCWIGGSPHIWIRFLKSRVGENGISDIGNFRNYLRKNPLTIYYQLETPQIIETNIEEQSMLSTYQPTYFTVDSGLAPSKTIIDVPVLEQVTGKGGALRTPATLDRVYLDIQGTGSLCDMMLFEGGESHRVSQYIPDMSSVGSKPMLIKSIKKNLFDVKNVVNKLSAGKLSYIENGFRLESSSNMRDSYLLSDNFYLAPLTTYTLSYEVRGEMTNGSYHIGGKTNNTTMWWSPDIFWCGGDCEDLSSTNFKKHTKTFTTRNCNTQLIIAPKYSTEGKGWIEFRNIQIEFGNKATSFEPYLGVSKTIALKEPLRGLPNGVKDTIEKVNGEWKIIRRCGSWNITAKERSWRKHMDFTPGLGMSGFNFNYKTNEIFNDKNRPVQLTSKIGTNGFDFSAGHGSTTRGIDFHPNGNGKLLIESSLVPDGDVAKLQEWFRANPTVLVYELATPYEEPMSTLTLQAWKNGSLLIEDSINVASTHTVALNKPGQILKNIEELTILRDRVKKLEGNYDQLALEQSHQLALTKQSIELDYEL